MNQLKQKTNHDIESITLVEHIKSIHWHQHLLALISVIGLIGIYFAIEFGMNSGTFKDLLMQLIPEFVGGLIALIVAYYFYVRLEANSTKKIYDAIKADVDFAYKRIEEKYDSTQRAFEDYNGNFFNLLNQLNNKVTAVTWSSDIDEHDTNVFNKMADTLDDPSITGMDVISIFHKSDAPKADAGKNAIKNYYQKIEKAIEGRKIRYRRVVVVRKELGKKSTEDIRTTIGNRSEFIQHCQKIRKFNKENAEIKFIHTDGRIIDVAFALFYQGNVQDKVVRSLVIELTVWSDEKSNHVMGLLGIERPTAELIKAFTTAFISVFEAKLNDVDLKDVNEVIF